MRSLLALACLLAALSVASAQCGSLTGHCLVQDHAILATGRLTGSGSPDIKSCMSDMYLLGQKYYDYDTASGSGSCEGSTSSSCFLVLDGVAGLVSGHIFACKSRYTGCTQRIKVSTCPNNCPKNSFCVAYPNGDKSCCCTRASFPLPVVSKGIFSGCRASPYAIA